MGWTGAHWGGVFLDPTPNDPFEGFRTLVLFFFNTVSRLPKTRES